MSTLSSKTQEIVELNTLLARANRLELPEAQELEERILTMQQQYTPVQNFIERMQSRKSEKASPEVQGAYTLLIVAGSRHQETYGEAEMPELIHYLDGLVGHPDLHPDAAQVIRSQADDLQQRLNIRCAVEAVVSRM